MTAEILRPAPVLGARRAPQLDSNKHDQLDKSLRKRASDAAGKDSEQQEHRQQEADTRAADCMTEHSPYVWNPQSQRYERRRPSLAEAHQRSNDLQAQHYSPAAPASAAYQPHPQQPLDWNPWAYLDNSQQRPYTPSQPAVQPGTDLSEPYTHHNFQGRPVRPSQTLVNVYDSHESPRPGLGASSSVATPARGEPSHQYQPHYQATYAYSGWQADRSTFAPQDVSISLPPLNIPSRYSTADLPVTYKSSYTATSHTAASATAGYSTRYSPPVPPATTSYQGYDPLQPSRLSGDEAYHSIVPVDTANTAAAASIRTTRRSSTDWKDFLDFWKSYIEDGERVFVAQAAEGLIENYTPRVMAAQRPTFADCDVRRHSASSVCRAFQLTFRIPIGPTGTHQWL